MAKRKLDPNSPTQPVTKMFGKQGWFVKSRCPHVLASGGRGGGKTRGGALKALLKALECPGSEGMIAGPNYPSMRKSTMPMVESIFPEHMVEKYWNEQDKTMRLHNGSIIYLASCDDPDSLRGPNLTWYWLDEGAQVPRYAFDMLEGCLRQTGFMINGEPWVQQGWVTTTPRGFNWVYQEFVAQERLEDYECYYLPSHENPHNPDSYVKRMNATYAHNDKLRLQEVEGLFINVQGDMFFNLEALEEMVKKHKKPIEERLGHTKIYKKVSPTGRYTAGLDSCWGETGSYACCAILDDQTGEEVAEIHTRLMPDEMAAYSVRLCREYNDAWLTIEQNGEGANAVRTALGMGYKHRMFTRDRKEDEKYGFWTDSKTRPLLLGGLEEAIRYGHILPNKETIDEYFSFVRDEKGKPVPLEGCYSDRVMASALAWFGHSTARFDNGPVWTPVVTQYNG